MLAMSERRKVWLITAGDGLRGIGGGVFWAGGRINKCELVRGRHLKKKKGGRAVFLVFTGWRVASFSGFGANVVENGELRNAVSSRSTRDNNLNTCQSSHTGMMMQLTL